MISRVVKKGLMPAFVVFGVIAAAIFAPAVASASQRLGTAMASYSNPAVCYAYPACAIYTTDAFGPVHEDQHSPELRNFAVFPGDFVRAAHFAPATAPGTKAPYSGLTLDAFGGLHPYNPGAQNPGSNCGITGTPPCAPSSAALVVGQEPSFNFDIARDFVFLPNGTGGYEIDGYGGIHPFSLGPNPMPPAAGQYPYYPGRDLAKKITILSSGTGGYEIDAFGGIHPWSAVGGTLPAQETQEPYYPNLNIARDLWLDPASTAASSSGYELDGYGGFHPWAAGTAILPVQMSDYPYYPGVDIARIMWFQPNASSSSSTGYQLDGYGGIHPFNTADNVRPPDFTDYAYWAGRDIARALFGSS